MADFTFSPNSQVPETLVRETPNTVTMNGWTFSARPTSNLQRRFKVRLFGLRWYLNPTTGLYDSTTNPTINARALELFYLSKEMWAPFTWTHPHLGLLTVRFAAPVNVPAAPPGSEGWLDPLEIMFVEGP